MPRIEFGVSGGKGISLVIANRSERDSLLFGRVQKGRFSDSQPGGPDIGQPCTTIGVGNGQRPNEEPSGMLPYEGLIRR